MRPYQAEARQAFRDGLRRQVLIWHRRAGKDIDSLDMAAGEAVREVGTYWHLYPTHVQAKRAIWNGIDARAGVRFIDRAFPKAERAATRVQDMQIELKNGSLWQLCGSDRYDSLVGSNPLGVTFSEWALCDPRAWDYVRPIIRENGGWVRFITTYRGRNHAYRMANRLRSNPDWYVDVRSIENTTDINGAPLITEDDIAAERAEGMSEALIQQEYYCNPIAAQPGAIYGKAVERLVQAGRLGAFAYDSSLPVFASWSTEFADQYTVTFWQARGNEHRLIGSRSFPFENLEDCIALSTRAFPWRYIARHILPHDCPSEIIAAFENHNQVVEIAPDRSDVFSLTRAHLATTFVDNVERPFEDGKENNENFFDALNGYRFSDARGGQSFTNNAVNSWEKHYCRSLEVFAAHAHDESLDVRGGWNPRPDMTAHDRLAI